MKVLIEELLSASGAGAAATAAAAANAPFADDSDDDGWEDDDTIDLSLAKADLMSYMAAGPMRRPDDETQTYLTEFFVRCGRENTANFQDWYGMLSQDEQNKLNEFANAAQ